jgi:hypothetical protein
MDGWYCWYSTSSTVSVVDEYVRHLVFAMLDWIGLHLTLEIHPLLTTDIATSASAVAIFDNIMCVVRVFPGWF